MCWDGDGGVMEGNGEVSSGLLVLLSQADISQVYGELL